MELVGGASVSQLAAGHQHRRLAGGDIDVIELAVVAAVIALHERDLHAVGTPFDRLRGPSEDAGILKDGFNGQLFRALRFLRESGVSLGEYKKGREQSKYECREACGHIDSE